MTAPGWSRRSVLRNGALVTAGVGVGTGAGLAGAHLSRPSGPGSDVERLHGGLVEPFHGQRQAGVETPPQAHLSLVGLDLRDGAGAQELALLLGLLGDDAARLSAGEPALADTEPELATVPSRLTVTFGLGPRAAAWAGATLEPLPDFPGDRLDPAWGQTDLVVQVCAEDPLTLAHTRRVLLKDAAAYTTTRWVQDGYRRARGSEAVGATMRNVMGQVDGTVNVRERADLEPLVWDGPLGAHSTTMVVRRIRADMAGWDKVDRAGKELAVGRRLADGAPLTGGSEKTEPDFEAEDDLGFPVIDAASHIRRARSDDPTERFLRRAYNYTVPDTGQPLGEDSGLVFIAYAADAQRQFVPVQQRLADLDRLNAWVTTIGSAVYVVLPGTPTSGAPVVRGLTT
ncbi:Dyp-type peroxidase [Nocardioides marmoraquaticus]